jgi:hypothetical protein
VDGPLDRLGDRLGVLRVGGIAGEVDDQQVRVGLDDVDRHHRAGGLADSGGDPADAERVGAEVYRMVIDQDEFGIGVGSPRWV